MGTVLGANQRAGGPRASSQLLLSGLPTTRCWCWTSALDSQGIDFVDSRGSAKLNEIIDLTADAGVTLRLAGIKPQASALLARDGVLDRLGRERIHGNVYRAMQAQSAHPRPGPSDQE